MENLNDKSWYRLLKVIFIISFVLAQGISLLIVYYFNYETLSFIRCNNGKEFINPYEGIALYKFSNQNDLSNRCQYTTNYQSGFNPLDYGAVPTQLPYREVTKYNHLTSSGLHIYAITLFIIFVFFWLISRIFFYVVAKDKFLSGRLVNLIKKPFIKK